MKRILHYLGTTLFALGGIYVSYQLIHDTKQAETIHHPVISDVELIDALPKIGDSHTGSVFYFSQDFSEKLTDILLPQKASLYIGDISVHHGEFFQRGKLPNEGQLVEYTSYLHENNVPIYGYFYINESLQDYTGYEKVLHLIQAVDNFNQKYPNNTIQGVHLQQAPKLPENYDTYITLVHLLQRLTYPKDLINEVVIDPNFENIPYKQTQLATFIANIVDSTIYTHDS